jgi:uncharacterized protein (TIGR02421 family)
MDTAPAGGDDPPSRPHSSQPKTVRSLGEWLYTAQRPVRVLDAVRWDAAIEHTFLAHGGREPPAVTADYYHRKPLGFDPAAKCQELRAIERDALRRLGREDPVGRLLRRRCCQCRAAVELLTRRGTPAFSQLSRESYGQPTAGEDADIAAVFTTLEATAPPPEPHAPSLDAATAADLLARRLRHSLGSAAPFHIRLSDGLLADAAAGGRAIKLRRGARFTAADLALLEVHEGWVHLGTTLSGRRQPAGRFLSLSSPANATTQEGLAVFCEVLTRVCHADRVRRLRRRYEAVRLADAGADFRDVYRHFLVGGDDPRCSYRQAVRVFRGSLPTGCGPFAKDLTYALGFVRLLCACRAALRSGRAERLALLFCGKTSLADLPLLSAAAATGLLRRPTTLPPPFGDRAALARRLATLPHPRHRLPTPYSFGEPAGRTPGNAPADHISFQKGDVPRAQ